MRIALISNFSCQRKNYVPQHTVSFGCTGGLGDIFPDSFTPDKPNGEDRTKMFVKVKRFSADLMKIEEKDEAQLADMAEYFGAQDDFFVKLYCKEAYGEDEGLKQAKKLIPYVQKIREYKKEASDLLMSLNLKRLSNSKDFILGKDTLSDADKERYDYIQKELQRLKEKESCLRDKFTHEDYEEQYV